LAKWIAINGDTLAFFAKSIKGAAEAYFIYKTGIAAVTAATWLQAKALQATILLRGEETVAVNALTAANERLASSQLAAKGAAVGSGAISAASGAAGAGAAGVLASAASSVILGVAVMYFGAQALNALGDKIKTQAQSDFDRQYERVLDPNDPKGFKWVERLEKVVDKYSVSVDKSAGALGIVNAPKYDINTSPLNFGKFVAPKTATNKKATATTDPLKADINKVTGQQVRNTYVTINGGLVHEFNVKTQTLKESAPEIKRLVTQVLTDAINDSQITD